MAFEEKELKIITENESYVIRVVDWNGRKNLVKQSRWETDQGEIRNGKVKAFSNDDLLLILENINEIKELMSGDEDKDLPH